MNPLIESIDEVLLDVRNAYRLLHDYQSLAMNSVTYIAEQLQMRYSGGYPKFSDATPRPGGSDGLERWAWDWLNMLVYEFHFDSEDSNPWIGLSVLLISDTGFYCSKDDQIKATETDRFLPASQSETLVGIILTMKDWRNPKFMSDRSQMKHFIETKGGMPEKMSESGMVAACYPFSRMATEPEASALVDDIVRFAGSHGIPLNRRHSTN